MGTRSRIAVRHPDGTCTSVYCHWDGYPSNNGKILITHYNSYELASALVAGGDISSLGATLDATNYYTSSLGPAGCAPAQHPDLDDLKAVTQNCGGEWLYVYTPAGWQCAPGGMSMFGMPSSAAPGDLESVDYWLQREAHS